jgi:hypothetical protein
MKKTIFLHLDFNFNELIICLENGERTLEQHTNKHQIITKENNSKEESFGLSSKEQAAKPPTYITQHVFWSKLFFDELELVQI